MGRKMKVSLYSETGALLRQYHHVTRHGAYELSDQCIIKIITEDRHLIEIRGGIIVCEPDD